MEELKIKLNDQADTKQEFAVAKVITKLYNGFCAVNCKRKWITPAIVKDTALQGITLGFSITSLSLLGIIKSGFSLLWTSA